MASNIDPTVFPDNAAVEKANIRQQFQIAKDEITALQAGAVPTTSSPTFNVTPAAEPPSPVAGWVLYVDSGDSNKLKAKAATGTIVTLGTP